jgi:hypothetical protein
MWAKIEVFGTADRLHSFADHAENDACNNLSILVLAKAKVKDKITLRLTVSHYVLMSSPLWDLWPDITSCLKVAVLFLLGALSDERTGLQFAVQSLNSPSGAEPVTILYCLIWDSPILKGQVPVFTSLRNRVAQLCPRALGSFFVASYDSQDYDRGILCLYSLPPLCFWTPVT